MEKKIRICKNMKNVVIDFQKNKLRNTHKLEIISFSTWLSVKSKTSFCTVGSNSIDHKWFIWHKITVLVFGCFALRLSPSLSSTLTNFQVNVQLNTQRLTTHWHFKCTTMASVVIWIWLSTPHFANTDEMSEWARKREKKFRWKKIVDWRKKNVLLENAFRFFLLTFPCKCTMAHVKNRQHK